MIAARNVDWAAASTLEALMWVLRTRGPAALKETWVERRLTMLSELQLREIGARLRRLKPEIARAWIDEDIKRLAEAWVARHA